MSVLTDTAPQQIWLQISDDIEHYDEPFPTEDVTWCEHMALECSVQYVRADLFAERGAQIEGLRAELAAQQQRIAELEARDSAEMTALANENDRLFARCKELEADAARWREFRRRGLSMGITFGLHESGAAYYAPIGEANTEAYWDSVIDAARSAQEGEK